MSTERTERDRRLAALAADRHGIVTRDDVRRLGFTRGEVAHRVRVGRWEPMAEGVWRLAGTPATWEQRLSVAIAWAGPAGVLSGRTAAALWSFDGFERGPVELLLPRAARGRRSPPAVVRTTMSLPRIDRALVGGFPVTSASRTVIDLAALGVTPELLGNAIDSAVRDGHSSPAFLRRRLAALRGSGRRGVQLLDALMLDAGGHTYLERRFLQLLREAGLPRPRCQVVHRRDGRTVARVDFEFVPHPLVVEVSGRRGHVTEADRLRDAKRRNELQLAGIVVVELLSSTVLGDPAAAVAEVRRALRYVGALG